MSRFTDAAAILSAYESIQLDEDSCSTTRAMVRALYDEAERLLLHPHVSELGPTDPILHERVAFAVQQLDGGAKGVNRVKDCININDVFRVAFGDDEFPEDSEYVRAALRSLGWKAINTQDYVRRK